MEPFALMLWVFVVPLHAYVLQPSVNVMVTEESGNEGKSREYGGQQESVGEPLTTAGEQDSHEVDGAESRPRPEAGEVKREESYNAAGQDGANKADDEVWKRHEEGHREGNMEEHRSADEEKKKATRKTVEEEKNEGVHSNDDEEGKKEGELRAQEEEEKNERAQRNDDKEGKKGRELGADSKKDERREEENGDDKTWVEDEMFGEAERNLEEYRVEEEREEKQKNGSSAAETGTFRFSPSPSPSPSPSFSAEKNSSISHQGLDPLLNILPTADNRTVTPTVSHIPVTAGESREATFTPEKTNSKLVRPWTLTDGSRSHLREKEGLVPKAIEMKVGPFGDSTHMDLSTREQRAENKRSKFVWSVLEPKKKKTHPANNADTKRSKQQNKVKPEQKKISPGKKDKSKKNKNKKQKGNRKTLFFPYFKDDYCPLDCACYGRVVQCSDKGVNEIPYGIPYNSRYILLMNNQITGIQLDLLHEYLSLEFLVLSNNRLTDGSIEGAFEGMAQLKRLYLDRNHLNSIPTDFPASLEELRLDSNNVSVMSEVAWASCPSLQILSLNNNSLGVESVPDEVFTPLSHLRTLSLTHNHLTATPLRLPTNIKELYLRGNHIEHVLGDTFTEGSDLLVLDLSSNWLTNKGLTKDSLQPLVHLENLNLEGNFLRQIPRHLPRTLRTLNLEGNAITTISKTDFLSLPHLEHLGLSRNQITRVAPGAFWGLPVLHQLELGHNILRQVPRRLPPSLRSVSLVYNKIQSIPRDAFCSSGKDPPLSSLVSVHLENNLIHLGELDSKAFSCLRGYQVVHFY